MNVAILGAGAGGLAAAVELSQNGHAVRLWNRSAAAIGAIEQRGAIRYTGVLGNGSVCPAVISTNLDDVLENADCVLVCLPTLAHRAVAGLLAEKEIADLSVVLNPGHTGGALEFTETFRQANAKPPMTAELSTLTYIARKPEPDTVLITGTARRVWAGALPGDEEATRFAHELYPAATPARDVLATGLANVNVILHPPGAILGAAWVESTRGDFTFYVQGLPAGVGRIMEALDEERLAVAAAFGHDLPPLFGEMQAIGTIEPTASPGDGLAAAVRGGVANQRIKAPDSLTHRYYMEDFCFGLQPLIEFARIAEIDLPVARSLMTLATRLIGEEQVARGRTAASMGVDGFDKARLLQKVRA